MFSRIILVCGSTTVKSHFCHYFGAKKKIWTVEISLARCLLSFNVLQAPCPLWITLLFGPKAVTELIIVSGRMVGLILVMQCVLRCTRSREGNWPCKGNPCHPHGHRSRCLPVKLGRLFPCFLRPAISNEFFNLLGPYSG